MIKRAVLVDGSNLYHESKKYNARIDFSRLKNLLSHESAVSIFRFYTALPSSITPDQKSFLEGLSRTGFRVKHTPLQDHGIYRTEKGTDVQLATDLLLLALRGTVDEIILISGDADYCPAVEAASDNGVPVKCIFWNRSTSDSLKQSCDTFMPMERIQDQIVMV